MSGRWLRPPPHVAFPQTHFLTMKRKVSLSLDDDLVEAAEHLLKKVDAPVSATINRWAKLGKQLEQSTEQPTPKKK